MHRAETTDSPESPRGLLAAAALPFALAVLAGMLCRLAAGTSLGLLLGGFVFAAVAVAPLVLAEARPWRQAMVAGAVVDGMGLVWLLGVWDSAWTLRQWLACYVLLAVWGAALGALGVRLWRMGLGRVGAAAVGVVLALLWLSWPVWLSPWLNGARGEMLVGWLVPPHPLMAVNAAVQDRLGVWSQQTLAYHLTNLGQHVAYSLPTGVGVAVMAHGAAAVMLLGWGWVVRIRK